MKSLARAADAAEVGQRLTSLREENARRWGRMTAHQMVCHLADSFRMVHGDKAVTPRTSLVERHVLKWIALYVPVPWPEGRIVTLPELDQEIGGTCPTEFGRDVAVLRSLVEDFCARKLEGVDHPALGAMSRRDWLRWGYLHCDHHLRQFGL